MGQPMSLASSVFKRREPMNKDTDEKNCDCKIHFRLCGLGCRGGLVGYDAALTQLRSWVRFPFLVSKSFFTKFECDE